MKLIEFNVQSPGSTYNCAVTLSRKLLAGRLANLFFALADWVLTTTGDGNNKLNNTRGSNEEKPVSQDRNEGKEQPSLLVLTEMRG